METNKSENAIKFETALKKIKEDIKSFDEYASWSVDRTGAKKNKQIRDDYENDSNELNHCLNDFLNELSRIDYLLLKTESETLKEELAPLIGKDRAPLNHDSKSELLERLERAERSAELAETLQEYYTLKIIIQLETSLIKFIEDSPLKNDFEEHLKKTKATNEPRGANNEKLTERDYTIGAYKNYFETLGKNSLNKIEPKIETHDVNINNFIGYLQLLTKYRNASVHYRKNESEKINREILQTAINSLKWLNELY